MIDCTCGKNNWCAIEYGYTHPEHYDGVSEWECIKCGRRVGRWSGKELSEGESEKRFGGVE